MNKILIILGIIGVGIVYVYLQSGEYLHLQSGGLTQEVITDECKEKARTIFPTRIALYSPASIVSFNWQEGTQYWQDGEFHRKGDTKYYYPRGHYVYLGSKEGQNSYYYYMRDNEWITYSKKVVDNEGVIIGYNVFEVQFILDSRDEVIGEGLMLKVVGDEFKSCKWVSNKKNSVSPIPTVVG